MPHCIKLPCRSMEVIEYKSYTSSLICLVSSLHEILCFKFIFLRQNTSCTSLGKNSSNYIIMTSNTQSAIRYSGGGGRGGRARGRGGSQAAGRAAHPDAEDVGNIPGPMPREGPHNMERYIRELEEMTNMVRRTGVQQRTHGGSGAEDDTTGNVRMPRQLQNTCIPRGVPGRVEVNNERQLRRSNFGPSPAERERAAAAAVTANSAAQRQSAEARSGSSKPVRTAANAITSPFLAAASSRNPLRLMPGTDPSQRGGAAVTTFNPSRREDSSQSRRRGEFRDQGLQGHR